MRISEPGTGRRVATARYVITLIVAVSLVGGCAAARKLRDAQEAFNQAATLENTARLYDNTPPQDPAAPPGPVVDAPRTYYRVALDTLHQIVGDESLKQDGLFVTKRTLEALCQWKLGQHDLARQISDTTLPQADANQEPRNWIILTALPGLIKIDQAHGKIVAPGGDPSAVLRDVQQLLVDGNVGALRHLAAAREKAKGHSIDAYLVQAQLSVYRNLQQARNKLRQPPGILDRDEVDTVKRLLGELRQALTAQGAPPEQVNGVVALWERATGVTTP